MINICKRCGKKFECKGKRNICPDCKIQKCVICGSEFVLGERVETQTCSRECASVLSSQNRYTLTCEICGEVFESKSKKSRICPKDHVVTCSDCGDVVTLKNSANERYLRNGKMCRCKNCQRANESNLAKMRYKANKENILAKAKKTNLARFGKEWASQSPDIQDKVISTNIQRYGVERPLQNENIRNDMKRKLQEKYGVDHVSKLQSSKEQSVKTSMELYGKEYYSQTDEYKDRWKETLLSKYGVDNPMYIPDSADKMKETCLKKYGEISYSRTAEYKERCKETSLKRYGVEYPQQSEQVKETYRKVCLDKYGVTSPMKCSEVVDTLSRSFLEKYSVPWPMMSDEVKEKSKLTCLSKYQTPYYNQSLDRLLHQLPEESAKKYYEFRSDPAEYIAKYYTEKPTVRELCNDLGVSDTPVYEQLIIHDCKEAVLRKFPEMERQICSILDSYDINYIRNDRQQIKPKELDIYIPEFNLAIECNPTATHNSSFVDPWGGEPKSPSYHMNKSIACKENGIFLFHVFGYEWTHRKDILHSMIINLIGKTPNKIYARKTEVKEVSSRDSIQFLNDNHRQGGTNASVRLGLYYNDELVSLMTFNKVRATMGDRKFDYELSRFCNKLFTNVVGGASRLFKHFINNYSCDSVVSFSDVAHTRGTLYSTLGFIQDGRPQSNYGWVDIYTDEWINRVRCQKKNLPNMFEDVDEETIQSHTEREIMESHGFAQVYESGTLRWVWNR